MSENLYKMQYILCLSVTVLLSIHCTGVHSSRTKRILPINKNCDPDADEGCLIGDWVDDDIADCKRTRFFGTCTAQNKVLYSWIVDVAEDNGCTPIASSGWGWGKKKKRFLCGSEGTNTRCVCSDYKLLPNTCRCQYWPDEEPDSTHPAFCTGYYTGGATRVHHWACCNNCNNPPPPTTCTGKKCDEDNSTESSCNGETWHGGSISSYCGSCGESTGGGRVKYYFNCESCKQQEECKDYCSGPFRNLPGFCWQWLDCFRGCCLARAEQPSLEKEQIESLRFCGDGTCESDETSETCPSDCCYQVNAECDPRKHNIIEKECCGDTTCCRL